MKVFRQRRRLPSRSLLAQGSLGGRRLRFTPCTLRSQPTPLPPRFPASALQAHQEGRLLEVFGSGTACIVQPVGSLVRVNGEVYTAAPFDPEAGLAARLQVRDWFERSKGQLHARLQRVHARVALQLPPQNQAP